MYAYMQHENGNQEKNTFLCAMKRVCIKKEKQMGCIIICIISSHNMKTIRRVLLLCPFHIFIYSHVNVHYLLCLIYSCSILNTSKNIIIVVYERYVGFSYKGVGENVNYMPKVNMT